MADAGATTAIWEKDNTATAGFHGETATRAPGQRLHLARRNWSAGVTDPQLEMTGRARRSRSGSDFVNPPGVYVIQAATRPPGGAFGAPVTVAEMPTG